MIVLVKKQFLLIVVMIKYEEKLDFDISHDFIMEISNILHIHGINTQKREEMKNEENNI